MIEIKVRKFLKVHRVELYDNIEQIPIRNLNKLQKYQLITSGIGSTIGEFDSHFERLSQLIAGDSKSKAMTELANVRHLFWHLLNEISPDSLAFACMVYSINGQEVTDISDPGIEKTAAQLLDMGITQKLLRDKSREVKKKLQDQLIKHFPDMFGSKSGQEVMSGHKRRLLVECDEVIEDKKKDEELSKIDKQIANYMNVNDFNGYGADDQHDKAFEKLCVTLQKHTQRNPKDMTAFEFHSLIDSLPKK